MVQAHVVVGRPRSNVVRGVYAGIVRSSAAEVPAEERGREDVVQLGDYHGFCGPLMR